MTFLTTNIITDTKCLRVIVYANNFVIKYTSLTKKEILKLPN